jgi:hypothetical protein
VGVKLNALVRVFVGVIVRVSVEVKLNALVRVFVGVIVRVSVEVKLIALVCVRVGVKVIDAPNDPTNINKVGKNLITS